MTSMIKTRARRSVPGHRRASEVAVNQAQTRFLGLDAGDPRRHWLALILLALCAGLLFASEKGRTLTADEPLHLVRGHSMWWTHDSQLSYAHPPLANVITAAPYAARGELEWGLGVHPDGSARTKAPRRGPGPELTRAQALQASQGWEVSQPLTVSSTYFRHDFAAAMAELRGARRMMMLWTLALGLFMYLWVERRWGWPAAMISLALFSVHPTLLAHGRLVTTDMPLAATAFVSLAALVAWIERPGWGRVAMFGVAATAMVLSKHSGLPLVVIMSVMVLIAAWYGFAGFGARASEESEESEADPGVLQRTGLVFVQLTVVAVLMILALDAAYMFDRVGLSVDEILAEREPHNWISHKFDYALMATSPIAKLPGHWRLPFPYTWLAGLATVSKQNALGHGNYFFSMRGSYGHPAYFPVMLFAKSPAGLLALLGAGLYLFVARMRRSVAPSVATRVLGVFALVVLASACMSKINIGVRHVLPLMPIMIVFAGRAGQLLLDGGVEGAADAESDSAELDPRPRWLRAPRRGAGIVLACMLGSALGAAWTFPAYLGDFSLLVGGPKGGHVISVIGEDWGQDVGDVARLGEERGWERVAYYTPFPLRRETFAAHGIETHKLRCRKPYEGPDPILIHLSDWTRRHDCFKWLEGREPSLVVNHHLLVFESQ